MTRAKAQSKASQYLLCFHSELIMQQNKKAKHPTVGSQISGFVSDSYPKGPLEPKINPVRSSTLSLSVDIHECIQADFPVPKPAITTLTPALCVKKSAKRSPVKQRAELVSNSRRLASLWKKNVPTFRVQGVFLSELDKRDIAALDKVIERMKDTPADACSGIWQDEEGETLLAAFAHQVPKGWQ